MKMRVLFLADMGGSYGRRETVASIQYRDFLPLSFALARVPHAPLLGPTLLCTILRDSGFDVDLMQMAFRKRSKQHLLEKLSLRPEVVCITTTFILDIETLSTAIRLIREHCPNAKIVLGGPSLFDHQEMRALGDYCILGEAEANLVPLLTAIRDQQSVKDIPGICYKDSLGNEITSSKTSSMLEMDNIPFVDWGLANRTKDEFYLIATQRGCAWRCAFCNYPALEGYKLRFRSIDNILKEINLNYEKYGIYRYMFADSTFTAPADRCQELLEKISQLPFKIQWAAFARVDTITPLLRDAMLKSGCIAVLFGIESGDQKILEGMKKRFTLDQARNAVKLMKESGIRSTASWIVGWPGENPDTIRRTVDFATELHCEQNSVNTFTLSGLSPASLRAEKFHIQGSSTSWKHQSMTYEKAQRWTKWAIFKLISEGVTIGSLFEYFHLTSLGLSLEEIDDLFKKTQAYSAFARNFKSHRSIDVNGIKSSLIQQCKEISKASEKHPLYL